MEMAFEPGKLAAGRAALRIEPLEGLHEINDHTDHLEGSSARRSRPRPLYKSYCQTAARLTPGPATGLLLNTATETEAVDCSCVVRTEERPLSACRIGT
jgi:hypothetical protein